MVKYHLREEIIDKEVIELEAKNTIEQVNILTKRIAELNDSIKKHEISVVKITIYGT